MVLLDATDAGIVYDPGRGPLLNARAASWAILSTQTAAHVSPSAVGASPAITVRPLATSASSSALRGICLASPCHCCPVTAPCSSPQSPSLHAMHLPPQHLTPWPRPLIGHRLPIPHSPLSFPGLLDTIRHSASCVHLRDQITRPPQDRGY